MNGKAQKRSRRLIAGLIFLFANQIYASENTLFAKPVRCIKPQGDALCVTNIILHWQSKKAADYCVSTQGLSGNINCWHNASEGSTPVVFKSSESVTYLLKQKNTNAVVAITHVKVVYSLKKKNRKWNRRRLWRPF